MTQPLPKLSSDFVPSPRRTNISVPSLEYGVATLDYDEPRMEILTRPSPESPPLAWQDVDAHFTEQAKRYNNTSKTRGVQILRLRRIMEVLRPGPLPRQDTRKEKYWTMILEICRDFFDKPYMLTADVQDHIRTAHDAFDERIRAENKAKEIAQRLKSQPASSSRPAPPLPSAIYQTSQPQARGPTLSATQLAHFNTGEPQDEDDDTKSLLSGVSISPSDSAPVASTRIPVKAAYNLDLSVVAEEVKPIDLWRASAGQPPASTEIQPERSSGGSGSQDSESDPHPDHVL